MSLEIRGEIMSTQDPPTGKGDQPAERLREHLAARFPDGVPDDQLPVPELSDDRCSEEELDADEDEPDGAARGRRLPEDDS
ncbi:MAG: hypothetical protein QOJ08_129 [Ilumatobacteraceae bacterium]